MILYSPIATQHNVGKSVYDRKALWWVSDPEQVHASNKTLQEAREYSWAQLFISSASAELQEVLALSWAHQLVREIRTSSGLRMDKQMILQTHVEGLGFQNQLNILNSQGYHIFFTNIQPYCK